MHTRNPSIHQARLSRLQRSCAGVIERLESRWMLSAGDGDLAATLASDSASFAAPRLATESDTGISSSDGITSDSTPLIEIDIPQSTAQPQRIWATYSTATGVEYVEIDPLTGSATGRRFADNWGSFYWSYGSALGEDRLYTMGSTSDNSPIELRTYDLATQTLISQKQIDITSRPAGGLAYLNGKLYAADTVGFVVIDPASGDILDRKQVLQSVWGGWSGTGPALAGAPDQNALYTITWMHSLTKIDPNTGLVLQEFPNVDDGQMSGLAYVAGRLYASTYNGQLITLNPMTGQRISTTQLPSALGYPVALAGDGPGGGQITYRVFDWGVQISGDAETSSNFQAPQLADGRHNIVVRYYDPSGNQITASSGITLRIDTQSPARPGAAAVDVSSDTGVSSSDLVTSDTTPLLDVPVGGEDQSVWMVQSTDSGLVFTEFDQTTGRALSTFTDASVHDMTWNLGAALGDGVLYVAGGGGTQYSLRTYSLATRELTSSVSCGAVFGLAYLNGKLYAADGGLAELDPQTGAVLRRMELYLPDGKWVGTGPSLAADASEGMLYSIAWSGSLVKIDPSGAKPLVVIDNVDPEKEVMGLAFAGGRLIGGTYDGQLVQIDVGTGQMTPLGQSPTSGHSLAMAGEGQEILYYRVFCDGVQIGGDYESSAQFQLPQLAAGTHIITIKAIDAAGNISAVGRPSTIRILTAQPQQPANPTLDPSSNTGDLSDSLTSDNTPLIRVPLATRVDDSLIRVIVQYVDGTRAYLIDPQTNVGHGSSQPLLEGPGMWDWTRGAALGNGLLYVIGADGSTNYGYHSTLRAYNAESGAFIYEVPLSQSITNAAGLGYLDGKLYVAGTGSFDSGSPNSCLLFTVDPVTGEMLNWVYPHQSNPAAQTYIGNNLTGAEGLGRLFAIDWMGQLVSIDPATGESTVLPGYDGGTAGLAYSRGELISVTSGGLFRNIDPQTGAVLSSRQLYVNGMYSALAGDGATMPGSQLYYRLFVDGQQVGGDYEVGSTFQLPELTDGKHPVTIAYVDAAGNLSAMSGPLNLRISTRAPLPRPEAPAVDASSDTGISSSDGITSDTTPLLNIPLLQTSHSFWAVQTTPAGLLFTEIDPTTGQTLSTFTDASYRSTQWSIGAALGDGVLYVGGGEGDLRTLRTYSLSTHQLIRSVPLSTYVYGLAYLNGKLYAGDSSLMELDPLTGAVLSRRDVFLPGWQWIGTGGSLAADADEGVLYGISWFGQLVKIDPATATPLAVIENVDPTRYISGLAFAGGRLIACTYDGQLSEIDPRTGQVMPFAQGALMPNLTPALAGEGKDTPIYYRVYSDGVQVSGDYESAAQFQLPELSAGTHVITIRYVDAAGTLSEVSRPTVIRIVANTLAQPGAPTLDPSSNTGNPADDLTADSTPLIHVPVVAGNESDLVRILYQGAGGPLQPNGMYVPGPLMQYLLDPATHTIVSRTYLSDAGVFDWTHGAALGDGLLYVIGTGNPNLYPYQSTLYVFNAENGASIYEVELPRTIQSAAGLAYLDGTLYVAASGMLHSIDPLTGEVLSSVYPYQWDPAVYDAIGNNLTAAEDLGRLFAIDWMGQFMSIDPATGQSTILPGYDQTTAGLAYANGELVSVTFGGLVRHIDPLTGEVLSTYQLPDEGLYSAAAGEGAGTPGRGMYYRVFADGVQISGDYELGDSFQMPELADGQHAITIAYVDAAGNLSAMSEVLTVRVDTTGPEVEGISINDGSLQRSMVNQITVMFSEPVTLGEGAIRLTLVDGSAVPGTTVSCANPSGDGRTYVLSFAGEAVVAGSLADGLYKLSIDGVSVQDLAGNQGAGSSYTFHRLFGDGAGDGSISREDLQAFVDVMSARYGQTNYTWYFDYDASGRITGMDMNEFIKRFVESIQA